jgi:hypothetical protein
LLNTGQLAEHETDAVQVRRMLLAAQRSIDDAKNETISPETRLDAFCVKRNAIDYSGDDVDVVSVESCIEAAERLLEQLQSWLINNRDDLVL